MKTRFLTLTLFAILLGTLSLQITQAQTQPITDPYSNYLRSLNEFYKQRETFELSRSRYNSFKTIQAKESTITDAKSMLQKANDTLVRYLGVSGGILQNAESTNTEVKQRILNDLRTHAEYLNSVQNTLPPVPTFAEINSYSEALITRYGYINSTMLQATVYVDTVRVLQLIDEQKIITEQIDILNQTLPQTDQKTQLVNEWVSTARQEISADEESMRTFLSGIYPQSSITADEKPVFEKGGIALNTGLIAEVRNKVKIRAQEAKDTYEVIKEIYQQL